MPSIFENERVMRLRVSFFTLSLFLGVLLSFLDCSQRAKMHLLESLGWGKSGRSREWMGVRKEVRGESGMEPKESRKGGHCTASERDRQGKAIGSVLISERESERCGPRIWNCCCMFINNHRRKTMRLYHTSHRSFFFFSLHL